MLSNIRRWVAPPLIEGDEERSRAASLLNLILWTFVLAALIYGSFVPIEPGMRLRRTGIVLTFVLALLFLKQMVNWGYVRSIGTLIVFALWVLFSVAMFYGADYHNPAFMGYVLVVVCAGLVLNWRAATGWGLLSIFTSAVFLILGEYDVLPPSSPVHPFAFWVAQTGYILVSTLLISQALRKIDEAFAKTQREIDERKRVEAEREKIIKELEAKNTELERFTYTVSHDLKSPLITISGFVGLLEADAKSGNTEKLKGDLQRIQDATEKMQRLLDELLELSRIGRLVNPPSDTPFARIVEEALSLTRGRLMAGHINVNVESDLPVVSGDRPRLVEVMQNLIDNAAKFMGDQPKPLIEIGVRKQGNEHVFFVKDNGIGIEPAYRERVSGLFDKLDPHSEGTGVGLALVQRIVEVHGGRIWVESEGRGKGSMFCFTLPIEE
ncbi:MAG TPA: ATP-binding protein [Anaerolineales bacterium]|nr:ATP-binding protein [Anaerolineales bacterium]